VTGPDIALRSIMSAFEGVIPATIATAAPDGTPNITYISLARFLDEERIAISNQFFGKTTSNLDGAGALDGLSVFVGRLDDCRELGDLTQTALELLDDLFGIGSSMLLMADHDLKSLFVVAHHGYAGGVGAEIAVGDGVIGVAAQRRRQVLVSHVTRAQSLYRAAARSRTEERHEIPLPGLAGAQSLVATPILLRGRLVGVLYVDSAEPGRFGTADGQLLDVIAR